MIVLTSNILFYIKMFTMKSFSKFMFLMATVTCLGQPLTAQHRSIPDALPLTEENIEWQREVYRILDLTTPENGGLYSPTMPSRIAGT